MKKLFLALLTTVLAHSLIAASLPVQNISHGYRVISEKSDALELEYGIQNLEVKTVKTDKGEFTSLSMNDGFLTTEIGKPALPTFHNLIEIPYGSTPVVEVISYEEKTIDLNKAGYRAPLMPAQPSYLKCAKPEEMYFRYDAASYQKNSYTTQPLAEVTKSGTIRGTGIGSVVVRPASYNPVTQKLTIKNNLRLRVKFVGASARAEQIKNESFSPYFMDSYTNLINHKSAKVEYTDLVKYPVTYLLVANSGLQNNAKLNEFIKWKTQKGFKVITNYVSSTATTSTIDSWIENQYNTLSPKPSFVLIVGDESGTYTVKTEVNPPIGNVNGNVTRSDLMYGVIGAVSTTNHLPSMYVGRFSVQALADLDAQVDKTIWYEKTQFTSNADLSYLARGMATAGADASYQASHGNPHVRYEMTYHINNSYTNPTTGTTNGMTGIAYYDGASGQASNIINNVNTGVAFYNYTAHGSNSSFADPTFSISSVNSLTNTNKYGLIIGNCCVTGSFGDTECFGESWLNAPNKGSIGYIGSSMNTTWNEDLSMGIGSTGAGQVASGNTTPPFTPNSPGMLDGLMLMKFPTQGGVKHIGLLAVETYGGDMRDAYWSAYHLFGDPSLMPFMGVPSTMNVTHASTITDGATSFTINAVKNAYIALSDENGVLHGAALTDANGVANVPITAFASGTNANLVVYAQFKKPVIKSIPVGGTATPNPTVAITAPANNSSVIVGNSVTVTANASETAKSISKVEFYVDNTLKATDNSAPYEYSWNTTGAAIGAHTVKVVATSSYNKTAENSITVNVDENIVPVTSITEGFEGTTFPPSGWSITEGWYQSTTFYSGAKSAAAKYQPAKTCNLVTPPITVSGTSALEFYWKNNDPAKIVGHDTTYCEISTNGTTWTKLGLLSAASSQSAYSKATYDITSYPGTAVKIRWRYKTNGTSSAYGITVDDVKVTTGQVVIPTPAVAITAPANNSSYTVGATVNVTAAASENAKSISKVEFYVDNTLKATDTSAPYEYAWNTTGAATGAHAVKAVVTSSYDKTAENSITVNLTGNDPSVTAITEGFEGTTFPPTGWTITSGWYQSTTHYAGSKSAAAKYKPANTCNLVTPAINVSGTSSLEFYWKNHDPAKIVGHDTTFCEISTNGTTWTRLGFLAATSPQSSYGKAAYDITNYPGTAVKIRWRYKTNGSSSAYGITVDDVKVTTGQAVTPVTSIAITAPANNANVVKGNSVTITAAVSEKSSASLLKTRASYKVEFYVNNSLLSTDTSSPFEYAWNTASATIGAYTIKTVVTNMDNNQTANAQISVNVIDGSTPVTLISEGFEGTAFPPTGWTLGSTSAWSKGSEAYAGSKCARALYNTAGTKILNAPAVTIPAGSATTLEFWWKNDDISAKIVKYDTTFCEISTNGTTWTKLGFLSAASSQSAYTKFTANVSAYTGTAVKIRWRYKTDGSYSAYGVGLDEVKLVSTTVKENRETAILPTVTNMISNYPNPFNPATTISFAINTASEVKLAVYNANGEIVKVLKEGFVNAGNHTVSFDGSALNSGMYFYTLSTQNGTMKGKMLLVK